MEANSPSINPSLHLLVMPWLCNALLFLTLYVSLFELAQMCCTQRLLLSLRLPFNALSRLCLVILFLWLCLHLYSFVKDALVHPDAHTQWYPAEPACVLLLN